MKLVMTLAAVLLPFLANTGELAIGIPENAVAGSVCRAVAGIREDQLILADKFLHPGPLIRNTDPHGRRPSGTEARARMPLEELHRPSDHIGNDLHPDAAAGAAVASTESLEWVPHFRKYFEVMCNGVCIGLEHRPPQMSDIMIETQPSDGTTGRRIVNRGFLPEEIGNDPDPVGAGRYLLGFPVEVLIEWVARIDSASIMEVEVISSPTSRACRLPCSVAKIVAFVSS